MSSVLFVPSRVQEKSNCAAHALLALFVFLVLGLPVSAFAKGGAGSDIDLEGCIQSFTRQLEDPYWRGQAGRRQPAPPPLSADAAAHEECIEFLVEMLANYDEQHQLQGRKPPPPPTPPPTSNDGPAARAWHAFSGNGSAVADASRLYLFAGSGSDWQPVPGDLWYFRVDQNKWILAPAGTTKPYPRQHVGFSCGSGQCVTSNGINIGPLKETWIYTEGTSSWSQVNCKRNLCPSARGMPTMAYDSARSYHVLFGGAADHLSLNDTYTFKGGRWTAHSPLHKPEARHWAATVFAKAPVNKVVLFGGLDGWASVHCNMYAWADTDWQEVTMTNEGPCLYAHSMAWDDVGMRLIVTGGYIADRTDTPNPDIWYFKFNTAGTSGTWSKEPTSSGLAVCAAGAKPGARMAYNVPSKAKVFFGGEENTDSGAVRYDTTKVCN